MPKTPPNKIIKEFRERTAKVRHTHEDKTMGYYPEDVVINEIFKALAQERADLEKKHKKDLKWQLEQSIGYCREEKLDLLRSIIEGLPKEVDLTKECRESDTNCVAEDLPACRNCAENFGYNQYRREVKEFLRKLDKQ